MMWRRLTKSIIPLALSAALSAAILWAGAHSAGGSVALSPNLSSMHDDGTPWD
ncbi:hypothetical protein GCM10020216_019720 [Nonomuraea helvata]